MFEASSIMFLYVESPLHAGTGRSLGVVDLPIQRERITQYPMVQASSVKGVLRSAAKDRLSDPLVHTAIFGPETNEADKHAGALSVGDARLLLFPVRSLAGVFAWTTSTDALARFQREAGFTNVDVQEWQLPQIDRNTALVNGSKLTAGNSVVLEEFSFEPKQNPLVAEIGKWIGKNALPQRPEYQYWRDSLAEKLCILPEDAFRDFVLYATEVQTHIKLNPETKTVDKEVGALWTEENLPVDTLLYVPLMATPTRTKDVKLSGTEMLQQLQGLKLTHLQLGGNETTGQGVVAVTFYGGAQ